MRGKRVFLLLAAVAVFAAGCGSDKSERRKGNPAKGEVEPTVVSTCLSERGFAIRPATADVAAQSSRGVEFEMTFYRSPEAARTAAAGKSSATAVENTVVEVMGSGSLEDNELAVIRSCIRESK